MIIKNYPILLSENISNYAYNESLASFQDFGN